MTMARLRSVLALAFASALLVWSAACSANLPKKIVLIGGAPSEGPARHDYPNGTRLLKDFLASSADAAEISGLVVDAHPGGWPADPHAFDGASTILWYFDGLDKHPLLDGTRRGQFESLMQRGVGLVVLHQASTVPADDTLIDLPRWLGGARYGTFDRTTESVALTPASHPITRGVGAFTYRDEFYPSLRFHQGGRAVTPILTGTLHVQYRQGRPVLVDTPEVSTVAWAFERDNGGRSFGFSGAHFLAALDQPGLRKLLLNAIFWSAGIEVPEGGVRSGMPGAATALAEQALSAISADPNPRAAAQDALTFHRDAQRSGWHRHESVLTPATVAGPSFGRLWESPPLDAVDGQSPRLYASPLYVDRVAMSAGQHKGASFPVVFAASNAGYVYAVNAFKTGDIAPGRILWRTHLGPPCRLEPAPLDAVPTGVLSTPVVDLERKRLYVTSCDPEKRWQAFALDIGSGEVLPGWPVRLDEASFNRLNRNPGPPVTPTRRFDFRVQRGALNLSPDGALLYVTFGETETGWLVSVDTARAKLASAFASVAEPHRGNGGIWGAGGPAVDAQGQVFVVTGSGFNGFADRPNDWVQSVLMLSHSGPEGFVLRGTYTPFNHCATATMDIDLGSGGAALLPDLATATTTPQLMVLGGKQGNVYLLDRTRLPGRLDRRQPCSTDSASDASLLPPQVQRQFGKRGPVNVFGPYSEKDGSMDSARARSVPAFFQDARGVGHVFVTGTSKAQIGSPLSIAPSLARLEVIARAGKPAYLKVRRLQKTQVLQNPGSPVVTSNGSHDAIVWVLDPNARRSAPLAGAGAPRPVLYAFDAMSLGLLWKSAPGELFTSGKYNEPAFARGSVFVGTDRIQAFGLGAAPPERRRDADDDARPAAASPAVAPAPARGAALAPPVGKALYEQRCAACHDHPQGNIPPRALIAARTQRSIVEALTVGAMRVQAAGLSRDEIEAVARSVRSR